MIGLFSAADVDRAHGCCAFLKLKVPSVKGLADILASLHIPLSLAPSYGTTIESDAYAVADSSLPALANGRVSDDVADAAVFPVLLRFAYVSSAGEDVAFVVATSEADGATKSALAAAAVARTSSVVCVVGVFFFYGGGRSGGQGIHCQWRTVVIIIHRMM